MCVLSFYPTNPSFRRRSHASLTLSSVTVQGLAAGVGLRPDASRKHPDSHTWMVLGTGASLRSVGLLAGYTKLIFCSSSVSAVVSASDV